MKGDGELIHDRKSYPIPKGTHFILPAETGAFSISGKCDLIVSHI
ncbi:hypothetical protein [Metabacillus hrfriensis]